MYGWIGQGIAPTTEIQGFVKPHDKVDAAIFLYCASYIRVGHAARMLKLNMKELSYQVQNGGHRSRMRLS